MEQKISLNIARLRKAKGMTQEQLAAALGISPPAVSKWETGSSCPDITLLCPLARALNTNVDTLLSFEETLPDEEMIKQINELMEITQAQGISVSEPKLQQLLHRYPSSTSLKYNAAMLLTMFEVYYPGSSAEQKADWKKQRQTLLEAVRADTSSPFRQHAVSSLATYAMLDDRLEEAEALLKELPEHSVDSTITWTQLYLKRGERQKALETVQKRLFILIHQAENCLFQLMSEKLEPDVEKALQILDIYLRMEALFGCNYGMSSGICAELYQRAGQTQKAVENIIELIDIFTAPIRLPNPLLFSAAITPKENAEPFSREMRAMLLQGLENDESFAEYRSDPDFQAAVERLRSSIGQS